MMGCREWLFGVGGCVVEVEGVKGARQSRRGGSKAWPSRGEVNSGRPFAGDRESKCGLTSVDIQ
jgi:hypothetical protein